MLVTTKHFKSKPSFKRETNKNFGAFKKALIFSAFIGFILLLFLAPLLHSIITNFNYFLEFTPHPHLRINFQRELFSHVLFVLLSILTISGIALFYSYRIFSKNRTDLDKISQHIHKLYLGQFHTSYVSTLLQNEELEEIILSLDRFQLQMIENTQEEILKLQSLHIDPQDLSSRSLIDKLIESKRKQIGQPISYGNVINLYRPTKEKKSA